MVFPVFAFVIGVWVFQFSPQLLSPHWCLLPLSAAVIALRWPIFVLVAALLAGIAWANGYGWIRSLDRMPEQLQGVPLQIEGTIDALPKKDLFRTQFIFNIEAIYRDGISVPGPARVRLNWYRGAPELSPGDTWMLTAKLRMPRGYVNPGAFDYQAWLFREGIDATGYVLDDPGNKRLGENHLGSLFQQFRSDISSRLNDAVPDYRSRALISALSLGVRHGVADEDWSVLRLTGTSHLFAISGLHVGIAAGFFYLLVNWLWRRCHLACLMLPAPKAAAMGSLLAAFLYAGLAGFSIPTQRALIMLVILLGAKLLDRPSSPFLHLTWAMLAVVLWDPLSVSSYGFWLSFIAVWVILSVLSENDVENSSKFYVVIKLQFAILLGLSPILMATGLGVSWVAPVVNLIVIPLFSLVIVPLLLLGIVLLLVIPSIGVWAIGEVSLLLTTTLDLLEKVSSLDFVTLIIPHTPLFTTLAILLGLLLILMPPSLPGRILYGLLMLPALTAVAEGPEPGEFWFTQLDVGQGQAAVIQTTNHLLLFDTGPRFRSGFNAGDAVVMPFLAYVGVDFVDRVILSNGDMDHRGGFRSVIRSLPVGEVYSGEPGRIEAYKPERCLAGSQWNWDGVEFEILHPNPEKRWRGNDASCVLKVSNPSGALLVTGDIEHTAEQSLVQQMPLKLKADVVTIPHHGSNSSSTNAFIDLVDAKYALVSAGYLNRYGFPKQQVISRWEQSGAAVYDSSNSGAIIIKFSVEQGITEPWEMRKNVRRYWKGI